MASQNGPVVIFCYFSGHGAAIDGVLHAVLPNTSSD
jgi:hypothetical protein